MNGEGIRSFDDGDIEGPEPTVEGRGDAIRGYDRGWNDGAVAMAQSIFDPDRYQSQARKTLRQDLTQNQLRGNMLLGLGGESGELLDYYKKVMFHGHEFDPRHVRLELGDLLWYIACLAYVEGFDLSEVMEDNIAKLTERYPDGFDEERSKNRDA